MRSYLDLTLDSRCAEMDMSDSDKRLIMEQVAAAVDSALEHVGRSSAPMPEQANLELAVAIEAYWARTPEAAHLLLHNSLQLPVLITERWKLEVPVRRSQRPHNRQGRHRSH